MSRATSGSSRRGQNSSATAALTPAPSTTSSSRTRPVCQPSGLDEVEQRHHEDREGGLTGDEAGGPGAGTRRGRSKRRAPPTARPRAGRSRPTPRTTPRTRARCRATPRPRSAPWRPRSSAGPTACRARPRTRGPRRATARAAPRRRARRRRGARRGTTPSWGSRTRRGTGRTGARRPRRVGSGTSVATTSPRARSVGRRRGTRCSARRRGVPRTGARDEARRPPGRARPPRPRRTATATRTRSNAAARAASHARIGSASSIGGELAAQHPGRRIETARRPLPERRHLGAQRDRRLAELALHDPGEAGEPVHDLATGDVDRARTRGPHRHQGRGPQGRPQGPDPRRERLPSRPGPARATAALQHVGQLCGDVGRRCARSAPTTAPAAP